MVDRWYRFGNVLAKSETDITPFAGEITSLPPASNGYAQLVPSGERLPSDEEAAAKVRRSTWEPRPENKVANQARPNAEFVLNGYSGMKHEKHIWGRVNGQAQGTTDELIQHYAHKWGIPDNVIRAVMVVESDWYQNRKDANGAPVPNNGYGDYGVCPSPPTPNRYGLTGPSSFGISQIRHCLHTGTYPWSEDSTSFALDYFGAVIRGTLNGWDIVSSITDDLWGAIGRWHSGAWYDSSAQSYISAVQAELTAMQWLNWAGPGSGQNQGSDLLNGVGGFENTTTSDFAAVDNCALSNTAAVARSGTRSLQLRATASGPISAKSSFVFVEPETEYTVTAYSRAAATPSQGGIQVKFYDGNGNFLSTSEGTYAANSTSAWTAHGATVTSPEDARRAEVVLRVKDGSSLAAPVADSVYYFDDVAVNV